MKEPETIVGKKDSYSHNLRVRCDVLYDTIGTTYGGVEGVGPTGRDVGPTGQRGSTSGTIYGGVASVAKERKRAKNRKRRGNILEILPTTLENSDKINVDALGIGSRLGSAP